MTISGNGVMCRGAERRVRTLLKPIRRCLAAKPGGFTLICPVSSLDLAHNDHGEGALRLFLTCH